METTDCSMQCSSRDLQSRPATSFCQRDGESREFHCTILSCWLPSSPPSSLWDPEKNSCPHSDVEEAACPGAGAQDWQPGGPRFYFQLCHRLPCVTSVKSLHLSVLWLPLVKWDSNSDSPMARCLGEKGSAITCGDALYVNYIQSAIKN